MTRTGTLAGLALALIAALALFGQTERPTWEVGSRILPTSAASPCGAGYFGSPACGATLHLDGLVLVNPTGSAVTVTVTDVAQTSGCGNGLCTLFSASIAANTTYTVDLRGERANQGFQWSATSSGVFGWINGH
jgi:hypothetical protein